MHKTQRRLWLWRCSQLILDWFVQICFALKYVHSIHILHRGTCGFIISACLQHMNLNWTEFQLPNYRKHSHWNTRVQNASRGPSAIAELLVCVCFVFWEICAGTFTFLMLHGFSFFSTSQEIGWQERLQNVLRRLRRKTLLVLELERFVRNTQGEMTSQIRLPFCGYNLA